MQAASSDALSLDGVVASGQDAVEPSRSNPPEHQFDAGEVGLSPGGLIRAHGAYSGASACSCACKYARYQDSSPCTMLAGVSRVVFTVCESVLWSLNGPNSLLSTHHTLFHAVCAEQSGAMSARNAGSQGFPPSTAESRLGESSLVTAPYVRGGRVC